MQRIAIVIALTALGCTDDTTTTTDGESYAQRIQPIWDRWCTECHAFNASPRLSAAHSARDLMGVSGDLCDGDTRARFVVPGDPAQSYLLYKLTGENTNNYIERCDRLMPADGGGGGTALVQLDPAAVETIRQWIVEGASFD